MRPFLYLTCLVAVVAQWACGRACLGELRDLRLVFGAER
jgi:hypothetical protein